MQELLHTTESESRLLTRILELQQTLEVAGNLASSYIQPLAIGCIKSMVHKESNLS